MKGGCCRCDSESWPVGVFGGKADNLYVLSRNGFAVPCFFAVSSEFCDMAVLESNVAWLGDGQLAVRSSGLQEDSDDSALAGANATFLNVSKPDVWPSIQQVRSSSAQEAAIPVVVQLMKKPRFSGVAFSRSPVSGENRIVIDLASGLGEQVLNFLGGHRKRRERKFLTSEEF